MCTTPTIIAACLAQFISDFWTIESNPFVAVDEVESAADIGAAWQSRCFAFELNYDDECNFMDFTKQSETLNTKRV